MQCVIETSEWSLINYTNWAKSPSKKNYSLVEAENLAFITEILSYKIYQYRILFTVITDHKPFLLLYNTLNHVLAQINNQYIKLQGFDFTVKYKLGQYDACDYQSQHLLPIKKEEEDKEVEDCNEYYINAIISNGLLEDITL